MLADKIRIAVLSGGWSKERNVSLKSGEAVVKALNREKYDVFCFDPKKDLEDLWRKKDGLDLVFSVLHGKFGEDGRIQGLLDVYGIPFVGSGVLSSAMAMNKRISKEVYRKEGLMVPREVVLRRGDRILVDEITNFLGRPVVIKPASEGSSIGISIVEEDKDILTGIEEGFEFDEEVLVEEYLKGREITGAVLGRRQLESLPLIEIVPKKGHRFFDFDAKYIAGETREICPAEIGENLSKEASEIAARAHRALQCRDWSRTDMIIKKEKIYVLETNTIPGMTETSLVPLAAKGKGWGLSELLDEMVNTCLRET